MKYRFETLESRRLLTTLSPDVSFAAGGAALDVAQQFVPADVLVGASFLHQPNSVSAGVATHGSSDATSFPTSGSGFGVLSTGNIELADDPNNSGSSGSDLGGSSVRGDTDRDVTTLRVDIMAPEDINCLIGLDFQFLSEEFPEFVGSSFNDAFIAELDQSTWTTSGSTIVAPDNFAFDGAGDPITINTSGATSMTAADADGTTFDGATQVLRARTPITPGAHSIYLSIFDQGDNIYDSAVFLDNLRFANVADVATQCKAGADIVDAVDLDPNNTAPTVTVMPPGASALSTELVTITGSSIDVQDGDISSALSWTSSIDGSLGVGAEVHTLLSPGSHTITALSTDSQGLSVGESFTFVVWPVLSPVSLAAKSLFDGPGSPGTPLTNGVTLDSPFINQFTASYSTPLKTPPTLDLTLNGSPVSSQLTPHLTFWSPDNKDAVFQVISFGLTPGDYTATLVGTTLADKLLTTSVSFTIS